MLHIRYSNGAISNAERRHKQQEHKQEFRMFSSQSTLVQLVIIGSNLLFDATSLGPHTMMLDVYHTEKI